MSEANDEEFGDVVSRNQPLPKEVKLQIDAELKEFIRSEISIDKSSLFTIFGIFASIVVFLSVEIQFLRNITYFMNIIGFSLIIVATLLTFILLLDYVARGYRDSFKEALKKFPWLIFCIIISIFVAGFWVLSPTKEEVFKENLIFKKYQKDFNKRQGEIEMIYDQEIKNLQNEINNLSNAIENLEKSQKN